LCQFSQQLNRRVIVLGLLEIHQRGYLLPGVRLAAGQGFHFRLMLLVRFLLLPLLARVLDRVGALQQVGNRPTDCRRGRLARDEGEQAAS